MKSKIILFITLWSLFLWVFFVLEYKKYLDFKDLYFEWMYEDILLKKPNTTPETYHNYGQTALLSFMTGGYSEPSLLIGSNEYFSGSLLMQEHEDTRIMYEFTSDLLELFQDKIQQQQQQDSQWEQQEWQEQSSEDGENQDKWEQSNQAPSAQNGRDSEYFLSEKESIQPLSEWEQQKIEQSIEKLKRDQMRNQQFYWKQW